MTSEQLKPLVGVISDVQQIGPHLFHTAGDKYLRALTLAANVIPVIIPAVLDDQAIDQWLARLDGIFLTGAYSMIDPAHYQESKIDKPYDYDAARDDSAFQIVRAVMRNNIPLLGVCRGLQDINVALGGSLHQAVQEVAGKADHRENKADTLEQQFAPRHSVQLSSQGRLKDIYGCETMQINSVHSQGINRLADGLVAEATAPDGLVEAVRIEAMSFGFAVQWHPEWQVTENPTQKQLFEAFGEACRTRQSIENR
ncbi:MULTISPECIES: gamma-glutamyl-gamma-aminobutyrate hydrolase family protein [Reinekea]|jgi:putative glutamine amidotransferase|uniref:gamma-glutamyl-gamma-aminobutyrate hydrolase n=2 Tax=Reinekea TaxID=230494 RepID=A0A2K8KR50_9GAMM|nr:MULTISPECIES: gamma-glutamyl-gamma-aminobutyrate hydrolase family protein [Reinekea]ATX75774.1 gamma-glutamyl-GABA hydrolase / peptidase, C26 family [Reinekea forsetii]